MNLVQKFLPIILVVALGITFFSYLPLRRQILYSLHLSGDKTTSCCSASEVAKNNGNFDEAANIAFFNGKEVDYRKTSLAEASNNNPAQNQVLGTKNAAGEEKWIEVSIDQQRLRA